MRAVAGVALILSVLYVVHWDEDWTALPDLVERNSITTCGIPLGTFSEAVLSWESIFKGIWLTLEVVEGGCV